MPKVSIALLVVCIFLVGAIPVDAGGPADPERQRYRAEFFSWAKGLSPMTVGTVYLDGEAFEATASRAADIYADHQIALKRAAEAASTDEDSSSESERRGSDPKRNGSTGKSAQGPLIGAGFFSLQEQLEIRNGNPSVACSQLQEQRHYNAAVHMGGNWYLGAAYSDVAAQAGGYGLFTDVTTGDEQWYSVSVAYGGYSTFLCIEMPIGAGQIMLLNAPTVEGGFVVGATD